MVDLDEIGNILDFLVKENLRLTKRIINISNVIINHSDFTENEVNSILNPGNYEDYKEEEEIIKKLHYKRDGRK